MELIGELQFRQDGNTRVADLGDGQAKIRFVGEQVDGDIYGFYGFEGKTVRVTIEALETALDVLIAKRNKVERSIPRIRRLIDEIHSDLANDHLSELLRELSILNQQIAVLHAA